MAKGDPYTEQQLGRLRVAIEQNEKGSFGSNTEKISVNALSKELMSEPLFSGRTPGSLRNKIKEVEIKLAAEAAKSKPKPPPSYQKEDEYGRYTGHWNMPYKCQALLVLTYAGPGALLTLLQIKNAFLASLPKDHDFVFDNVALIDAMNTAIYLGQIEMVRRSNCLPQFKLKEEFIRKRNKVLKELGRESECTKAGGKGK